MTAPVVACPYCTRDIAVAEFARWTDRHGLLSAPCNCGRTITMAAATLYRRTSLEHAGRIADGRGTLEAEDYELACARLEWVRATACLHLPAQRDALNWHLACCEAAHGRLHGTDIAEVTA